jgi:lysyl-tRNA synthetase
MSDDENKLIAERRAKLDKLRNTSGSGVAFPNDFRRDALADQLLTAYGDRAPEWFDQHAIRVKVGGRMLAKRVMGKASFAKIADRTGQLQVFAQSESLGATYDEFKGWDVGDVIGVEGALFKTKTGELTVRADKLRLLVKSLRPLPDKWHGLADQEIRYRQRYVDLIVSPQSAQVFKTRTRIIKYLRDFLDAMDFLEVETPMMQTIAGGAVARPFVTHHNALDMQLYLRIAPELFLKRLLVGGFERVYEINRNFRNEGISTKHNPEFTMLELYQAYADFSDFMNLVERMCQGLCDAVVGSRRVEYQGEVYDFAQPFRRVTTRTCSCTSTLALSARGCAKSNICAAIAIDSESRTCRATAPASCSSTCSRRRPSIGCCSRRSCMRIRRKCRRWHGATIRIRSSRIGSNSLSAGARSRMASRSSTIRRIRRRASRTSSPANRPAIWKRCSTTPITSARWNTACRRRRALAWASIGW